MCVCFTPTNHIENMKLNGDCEGLYSALWCPEMLVGDTSSTGYMRRQFQPAACWGHPLLQQCWKVQVAAVQSLNNLPAIRRFAPGVKTVRRDGGWDSIFSALDTQTRCHLSQRKLTTNLPAPMLGCYHTTVLALAGRMPSSFGNGIAFSASNREVCLEGKWWEKRCL